MTSIAFIEVFGFNYISVKKLTSKSRDGVTVIRNLSNTYNGAVSENS